MLFAIVKGLISVKNALQKAPNALIPLINFLSAGLLQVNGLNFNITSNDMKTNFSRQLENSIRDYVYLQVA